MKIRILGSGAGGGVPQWNCAYRYSSRARAGDRSVQRRTQSSIAVSANDKDWVLINASPDIGEQLLSTPALHPDPHAALRSSPIKAVVITNADVDHIAGLLTLRERQPLILYASARVLAVLDANPIFRVLNSEIVKRVELPLDRKIAIEGPPVRPACQSRPIRSWAKWLFSSKMAATPPASYPAMAIRSVWRCRPRPVEPRTTSRAALRSTMVCVGVSMAQPRCCSTEPYGPTPRWPTRGWREDRPAHGASADLRS